MEIVSGRSRNRHRRVALIATAAVAIALIATLVAVSARSHGARRLMTATSEATTVQTTTTTSAVAENTSGLPEGTPQPTTTDRPAPTGASMSASTACGSCAPTTASIPTPPTTADPTPAPGDFDGTLTVTPSTVTADGGGKGYTEVQLSLRNITDHVVEPGSGMLADSVAFACTTDMTADGHTDQTLIAFQNLWFMDNFRVPPGGDETGGPFTYTATDADIGTVHCEAMIIRLVPGGGIESLGRLTNVAPVSITVDAPSPTSTVANA